MEPGVQILNHRRLALAVRCRSARSEGGRLDPVWGGGTAGAWGPERVNEYPSGAGRGRRGGMPDCARRLLVDAQNERLVGHGRLENRQHGAFEFGRYGDRPGARGGRHHRLSLDPDSAGGNPGRAANRSRRWRAPASSAMRPTTICRRASAISAPTISAWPKRASGPPRRSIRTMPKPGWAWLRPTTGCTASILPTAPTRRRSVLIGATPEVLNNQGFSYMLRGDYAGAPAARCWRPRPGTPSNPYIADNLALLQESAVERQGRSVGHNLEKACRRVIGVANRLPPARRAKAASLLPWTSPIRACHLTIAGRGRSCSKLQEFRCRLADGEKHPSQFGEDDYRLVRGGTVGPRGGDRRRHLREPSATRCAV